MDLQDIQFIFNRALSLTFSKKKLLLTCLTLLACGLLVVFFRSMALNAGQWVGMSLTFLPIFICSGVLVAVGVVLVRIYHDEIKERQQRYRNVVWNSLDIIIGTAYLTIPIILSYLLLWMLLGVFFLLNDTPLIGGFFSVILAFAPFLLNLGALLLCLVSVSLLFFVTPVVALRGINRIQLASIIAKRFQKDFFLNICLATIAAMPVILVTALLSLAAAMTGAVCYSCENQNYVILQWLFMMIPFVAILSPAVVFFFNFAAESHVLLQRQSR